MAMNIVPMSVEYCYHSGDDLAVVNAARVSFAKESKWEHHIHLDKEFDALPDKDVKLINYLAKHNHWTPFAHNSITLRIKAPIFVARQAGKHQVGLVWNEVSRRYVDDEPEFYIPDAWRGRPEKVKQGSSGEPDVESQSDLSAWVLDATKKQLELYTLLLRINTAPEQARMVLPQNTMTEWIWTGSLAAMVRIIKLRLDPHAQQEIQELAYMMANIVEPLFPVSYKALMS